MPADQNVSIAIHFLMTNVLSNSFNIVFYEAAINFLIWTSSRSFFLQISSRIFKTAYIGRLTLLLPFSRLEIHKKSTKNERFQCAITQVVLLKNSWTKPNTNLIFTLPPRLSLLIIDHAESCFFLPLFNPLDSKTLLVYHSSVTSTKW